MATMKATKALAKRAELTSSVALIVLMSRSNMALSFTQPLVMEKSCLSSESLEVTQKL